MSAARRCIGIVREVKNKWERRAPLTPRAVQRLTAQENIRVLLQPSDKRIFTNREYEAAGAELTEDLSPAALIIGVKEVPTSSLLANAAYLFFSHVIKAQPYNMHMLDDICNKRITLFDYECIRAPPSSSSTVGPRLVAFGEFAGRAGMIDALRGSGERLLSLGYSNPLTAIASTYMYPSLQHAMRAVRECGAEIGRVGLPQPFAPFRVVFTGKGNVTTGARAIFELLPHKYVSADQLASLPHDPHTLYGCVIDAGDMVQHRDGSKVFDKHDYYANPSDYHPTFHQSIAPHTSLLVNGMYWSEMYPRLLTLQQMHSLTTSKRSKLLAVADITCDLNGSVEFLKRFSSIERPFYLYNPITDSVTDGVDGDGVLMLGVENLPAELPREASEHFSEKLLPFIGALSQLQANMTFDQLKHILPIEMLNACISCDGRLTPNYEYIHRLRQTSSAPQAMAASVRASTSAVSASPVTAKLLFEGHLFDSGFINQALDILESVGIDFHVVHWEISPNRESRAQNISKCVVNVTCESEGKVNELIEQIQTLSKIMKKANAKVQRLKYDQNATNSSNHGNQHLPTEKPLKTIPIVDATSLIASARTDSVLVLGSGFVAGPLVEWLADKGYSVTVASERLDESKRIASNHPFVRAVELDVLCTEKLSAAVAHSDCVVSLLPSALHVGVAHQCLNHRKHLVTASYVSNAMQAMNAAAREKGLIFLNEVGLDPGLDHMSALKVIHDVRQRGGRVTSFESWCGGLPAPEAASNPFAYKFSWSPIGMLNATLNSASYRRDNVAVNISGHELMNSATPFQLNNAFALEQYANRDSLSYQSLYGLDDARTIYRGTLRYAGTCKILYAMRILGMMNTKPILLDATATWNTVMATLLSSSSDRIVSAIKDKLRAAAIADAVIEQTVNALSWLGVLNHTPLLNTRASNSSPQSPLSLLCGLLHSRLSYAPGERDLVLMIHRFTVELSSGQEELVTSALVTYGGDGHRSPRRGVELSGGGSGGIYGSGYSAMARTVGIPAAISVDVLLRGGVDGVGVMIPNSPSLYEPILKECQQQAIIFTEVSSTA